MGSVFVPDSSLAQQPTSIPSLFFIGAGNIAQSIIRGILRAQPEYASRIMVMATSNKNLDSIHKEHGLKVTLPDKACENLEMFQPDFVFLCVKPQVLFSSSDRDVLREISRAIPQECIFLSLLAGVKSGSISKALGIAASQVVRIMLNTAAEINSTSVFYHSHRDTISPKMVNLFELVGQSVVKVNDEYLMDVATGICGSGIAFFYEMIQTVSDIGVKNGLSRNDATKVAAQLSKSAGQMVLTKKTHPYQLRDEVTSPAGTTIFGLSSWRELSTGQKISSSVQASIDRAMAMSAITDDMFKST